MNANWQPSANMQQLKARALLYANIRKFFQDREVLEVETPLLARSTVTDPFIESMKVAINRDKINYYLQTSPEYAMKRLLAAGVGSIYQICKAFRQEELGHAHNPEFTLLEWYRIDYDHHQLMNEMDDLLIRILKTKTATRHSYGDLFKTHLQIDPAIATMAELANCAAAQHISLATPPNDKDEWLMILMSHCIEPKLGQDQPAFVYDFPASQAALAQLLTHPLHPNLHVAARFEVYYRGLELANGFYELQNAEEQAARFHQQLAIRQSLKLPSVPIDYLFLSALSAGLPRCAGVAMGLDRLLMLAEQQTHIADILSFDFTRV